MNQQLAEQDAQRAVGADDLTAVEPELGDLRAVGVQLGELYADSGTVEDLLAAIAALRDWATTRFLAGRAQVTEYLQPHGAFPHRRHIQVLFARFFADLYRTVIDWCDLAAAEVSGWDSTTNRGLDQRTRALLEDMLALPIPPHHPTATPAPPPGTTQPPP